MLTRAAFDPYRKPGQAVSAIAHTRLGTLCSLEWSPKEAFVMAENLTNQQWQSIAQKASTEQDPAKLTSLVAELCRSLDERQKTPQFQRQE